MPDNAPAATHHGNPILASGLEEPEGPVFDNEGNLYVAEMSTGRGCVTKISASGAILMRTGNLGRPNGITIDGNGCIWVAEARRGAVLRMSPDGEILATITGGDQPFLWPNDLRFGPDGVLYLTDSGIRDTDFISGIAIRPDWETFDYHGQVVAIDPPSGAVIRVLDQGIRFTNGIAFGPDGALYVNETIGGNVYRYDMTSPKPAREVFGNVNDPDGEPGWRGPDGMAFGIDGRLYCTVYGQGDITVLDSDGTVAQRLPVNNARPTNLAFDPNGSPLAAVTEVIGSCVETVSTPTSGLALHAPQFD